MQKSPQCLVKWQLVISKSDVEIILRRERGGRNRYETDVRLKRALRIKDVVWFILSAAFFMA